MMKLARFVGLFVLLGIRGAGAQVPQTLSWQGLLTDASTGSPLSGSHSVTFNFYTSAIGGTPAFSRGPLTVTTYQGLFTVILGNGQGNNNAGLPGLGSQQYYIGLRVDTNPSDLTPLVALTAVPYAFTASSLDPNAVINGSQVGSGISASNITSGTLAGSLVGAGIPAGNLTGTINGAQIGTGINASNITTGTLSGNLVGSGVKANTITGTLDGSVVGPGINAANITLNTLAPSLISPGTIDNSKLASGIDASKITTGILPSAVLPAGSSVPAGTIVAFAGSFSNIPAGWLECNGQSLSTAAPYDKLFAAIGTLWGAPDGSHFNAPNLQGYFLRGWAHGSGADPDATSRTSSSLPGAAASGDAVGSYQQDALQGHVHTELVSAGNPGLPAVMPRSLNTGNSDAVTSAASTSSPTDDGTNGTPRVSKESRPKNAFVIYIIRY